MKAGDIVEYKGKDYLAVKVNQKSAYICENRNFLNLWANRAKGTKWAELCRREEAFKVNPEHLTLKEEGAVKVEKKQTKKDRIISPQAEELLKEAFKRYVKKSKNQKAKNPFFLIENSTEKVFPVAMNIEKKMVLFHSIHTESFHFYDIEENKFLGFTRENNKKDKEIIWP